MNKKKNGFTLIELLIAVAIMLTIMGIAIVSFVNISNRKKKEAWNSVKGQIETAANSYIESNLYNYEYLNEGDTATVSVGTLVKDDYLNKVIDPRDGKAVSQCMLVKITKKDGIIETEVDENTKASNKKECDSTYIASYTPNGGPSITDISKKCGDSSWPSEGGWCNISISKNKNVSNFEVEAKENGNGKIVKYEYSIVNGTNPNQDQMENFSYSNGQTVSYKDSTNKTGKSICFKVTNINDVSSYLCKDFKADFIAPTGNVTIVTNVVGYNSNNVKLTGTVTDNNSGIDAIGFNPNNFSAIFTKGTQNVSLNGLNGNITSSLDGSTKKLTTSITDVAGNRGEIKSNDYQVYRDCDSKIANGDPTYGSWGSCTKTCGGGTQSRTVTQAYKDSLTGNTCPSSSTTATQDCNTQACSTLECPTRKVIGAVIGNNGWYKKGESCKNSKGEDYNFCLRITPSSSVDHWQWETGKEGTGYKIWESNYKGEKVVGLTDGKRTYRITVYDAYGNSRSCPYTANIDTSSPTVKFNEAAWIFVSEADVSKVASNSSGGKTMKPNSVTEVENSCGTTFFCAKNGEVKSGVTGCANMTVTNVKCNVGSSYTATDNQTPAANLTLNISETRYTNNNKFLYTEQKSSPYPFAVKYCLTATDEAGNAGTDCFNSIRKYSNKTYVSHYGWSFNPVDKKGNIIDAVKKANCWNYSDGAAGAECFKKLK